MLRTELAVVGGLTVLLLVALAITVPVEQSNRKHSTVEKQTVGSGRPLRFHLVGDYGQLVNTSDTVSRALPAIPVELVANQMANRSLTYPIDFIATTGDNVYPNGMIDIFDHTQFQLMYEYFNKPGLSGRPWYPVLGNHDCENTPPMLEITNVYPMWNMPSDYYSLTVELDNSATAVLIFLNGCTLACELLPGQTLLDYCDYNFTDTEINTQYQWLEGVLQDATNQGATWIMGFIHMPPFGAGVGNTTNGAIIGDDEALKLRLYPLLEQYNADLLFAGHNHLSEYLYVPWGQPYLPPPADYSPCQYYDNYYALNQSYLSMPKSANGMHEIVIGSSGHEVDTLCLYSDASMAELIYASTMWGFAEVSMSSKEVVVNYMNIESTEPVFTLVIQT